MLLTGKEFKKKYPNTKFYKLLTKDEIHNGVMKEGFNRDPEQFNPFNCCGQGLYFTDLNNLAFWLDYRQNLKWVRRVFIPDDAQVCMWPDSTKYKADKIILSRKLSIDNILETVFSDYQRCYNIVTLRIRIFVYCC